jgi:hypothetical protein
MTKLMIPQDVGVRSFPEAAWRARQWSRFPEVSSVPEYRVAFTVSYYCTSGRPENRPAIALKSGQKNKTAFKYCLTSFYLY